MLYPIMTETRNVIDLSGIWSFKLIEYKGEYDVTTEIDTDLQMAVPGSYNDQGVVSSIRNHVGKVVYETTFTIPNVLQQERQVLRFGSATHEAEVFVNGQKVVSHRGGFLPFEVEINDVVQKGKNRLTVIVNNILDDSTLPVGNFKEVKDSKGNIKAVNEPNFDFFNYAGLHRPVKIYTTPKEHYIEDIVIVPHVDGQNAQVEYTVKASGNQSIQVDIVDQEGHIVASENGAESTVEIENVHLWQPGDGYQYTLAVSIKADDEVIDYYEEPFGVRSIEVKNGQFLINGEPFYFKGFGKHEDTYYHGRGLNEVSNIQDLNLMKWIGANSFRTSHYPYSEEMMRLADEQGVVVIDETTAVGVHLNFSAALDGSQNTDTWKKIRTKEDHEQVIKELIARDKNLACVVMWSIANEPDSASLGAKEYFEPLVNLAKELDPQNRPCTIVTLLNSLPDVCQVQDLVDVLCLNRYYGWYVQSGDLEAAKEALRQELDGWLEKQPDKPIMFTEYGADTVVGLHAIDDIMFTEEYQVKYYEANHEIIDQCPNFVGEQVWNFADFETSNGVIRVQGNRKGIFTRERRPKAVAHYFRKRWNNIPDFGYKKK
ncbi:beta-glucuronidase [Mammaliicoccus sciuri]|uniref:beta-glucuronidase n=1 Tax=Mammaliicoccus sciuri TaxID=1296 RepID=UPI00194EF4BA|nr:beta-glucuronidase [Mammaliicoccus sciuri]MCD8836476.1 beta-glucuronidase [Mammaliicoccus sciuri]MCJ0920519.1 beta-glucuronidase [Mammaliicoccus sciuri]MCJ0958637.1 beta-glucuronidase [Mammaliicoccus sciuri]MCJ0963362.1 beta-glucuronidase [Mammaliicoccus sciuri]MCJ1777066.1 beta-glucuronidase [Mammaliicoccus sciuri]